MASIVEGECLNDPGVAASASEAEGSGGIDADQPSEDEGVVLSWLGRRKARVGVPKPRFLEEIPEHSDITNEDPGNMLIEGDNRQAMVSLLSQYGAKIDVVLIDPPYNTGKNDFRYDDARFQDPDADARRGDFVSAEDGGRHTKWLNQMAPTLRIIEELMAPHGVVFIHINDIELPRLLMLMEDIFGERNKIATIVWKNVTDNNPSKVVVEHEYVVVWAKDKARLPNEWRSPAAETRDLMLAAFERMKTEGLGGDALQKAWKGWVALHRHELGEFSHYKLSDDHGPYTGMRALHNPGKEGYRYDVIHPNGKPVTEPLRGYRHPEKTMQELLADSRIIFGPDETKLAQLKVYLDEADVSLHGVIDLDGRSGTTEITRLFPEDPDVFKNPKPVAIEELLLSFVASPDAVILDAFAGSGTTGHAVMSLNKKDGGKRRFILIEEGNEGDRYATSVTGERLRRARKADGLPGGFTFMRVGPKIDLAAFESFKRQQLAETILQTDASGRGGGIKRIDGRRFVVGRNARNEALCLFYDAAGHRPITGDILGEMYTEADELGLGRPLRVYGEACEVFGSESFKFFKLPNELANNLTVALRGHR